VTRSGVWVRRRARTRLIAAVPVANRALDGTPLFAPRGALPVEDGGAGCNATCAGGGYARSAPRMSSHAHGMTAADYRLLAGLRPGHPLQAPDLSATCAARLRRRITTDARLISGMAAGVALARNGELQRKADQALRARPVALERERQLAASGARLGSARSVAYRQRREQRARALGFAALEDFYRSRYVSERARLERLAAELACAESAVRGDLQRLGLGPDRTRSHGARWRQPT
jgi:hypothetical protein